MTPRRSTPILVLAVALCPVGSAVAEGASSEREARRLDRAGKAHYRAGNYLDAAVAFEAAFEAHSQPKYLFNLGKAYEKAGELPAALSAYRQYLELDASDAEKVASLVAFLRAKLHKTMGSVAVESVPETAAFRIEPADGGESVEGTTPYTGWLAPGEYRVTVHCDGHHDGTRDVVVRSGDDQDVMVVLAPEKGLPGAEADEAGPRKRKKGRRPRASAGSEGGLGIAPLGAFAVGGAALVAGGVFGALAFAKRAEHESYLANAQRPGHTREGAEDLATSADRYALAAAISVGIGVVAAGTGVTLWLMAPGAQARVGVAGTW